MIDAPIAKADSDDFSEVTLIIVPYNRPTFLKKALSFYHSEYRTIDLHIIVVDSSCPELATENRVICEAFSSRLRVSYIREKDDISLYRKLWIGAQHTQSSVVLLASDDDYILVDRALALIQIMKGNEDYSYAMGTICKVTIGDQRNPTIRFRNLVANESDSLIDRLCLQSEGMTTYVWGVHRRTTLLRALEAAIDLERNRHDQFAEYVFFFWTVALGKTLISENLTYIMMRHDGAATITLKKEFGAIRERPHFNQQCQLFEVKLRALISEISDETNLEVELGITRSSSFMRSGYPRPKKGGDIKYQLIHKLLSVLLSIGIMPRPTQHCVQRLEAARVFLSRKNRKTLIKVLDSEC